MMNFEVNGKEYKVHFGYGSLVKDNLIDRIANYKDEDASKIAGTIGMIAELLLAGLQKYHKEFCYDTPKEKAEKLDMVYDLMDEIDAEGKTDVFELNGKITEELMKSGFLSRLMKTAEEEQPTTAKAKKAKN